MLVQQVQVHVQQVQVQVQVLTLASGALPVLCLVRRGESSLAACSGTGALVLFFRVFFRHMSTSNPSCCRASFFVPVHVVLLWTVCNCPTGATIAVRVHDIVPRCLQLSEYALAVARSKMPQPRSIAPCPDSTCSDNTNHECRLHMCGECVKNFVNLVGGRQEPCCCSRRSLHEVPFDDSASAPCSSRTSTSSTASSASAPAAPSGSTP